MTDPNPAMRPIEGVLLLVDLCGSTAAQSQHGSPAFQAFRAPVRQALIALEKATGFHLLEDGGDQGDGFMLFRKHEPNASHEELITLFSEMQRKAPQLSTKQFDCALRYVAHFSAFQAHVDALGWPSNIQSTEAVRVFRAEKLANPGDLLITHELALRLHDAPERRGCKIETLRYDRPLKGLELLGAATTVFYRLRLPRQQDALDLQFPPLYRERRRLLREECRIIPVFGRVFDAIDMDANFIQLRLDPVSRRLGKFDPESRDHYRRSEIRRGNRSRHDSSHRFEAEEHEADWEVESEGYLPESARFTPARLDRRFRHGVILGLPGAGKTTILRYLTHSTLRREATTPLLFAASGALKNEHTLLAPYDDGPSSYTVRGALRLLLSVFLWPAELVGEADSAVLDTTTALFHSAWQAHEVTVLLDALDEARSKELRARLILAARALYQDLDHKRNLFDQDAPPSSRIFLTARRAFREELKLDDCLIFDVEPLDLGDLSQLARSVFDPLGKRQVADRFVAELPQQPAAVRLGGTPMMALLLLFYFDNLRGWASRYATYDTVLRFVLLKVWDQAKQQPGHTTLTEFLAATSAADFAQQFPQAGAIYDALADTAWSALYGEDPAPLRRLTRQDLLTFFRDWLTAHPDRWTIAPPAQTAGEWFELLRNAALFFEDGAGHFVFMHSTMLEYLAARWLTAHPQDIPAALKLEQRQSLETFPMLCSRDWEQAHQLLLLLPQHAHHYQPDSTLAFSCLAETEDAEVRALDQYRAAAHRRPLQERMDRGQGRDPIDEALGRILWSEDPEPLTTATARFLDLLPLKRDTFPQRWASRRLPDGQEETWFTSGLLRKQREDYLKAILHPDLHLAWINAPAASPRTFNASIEMTANVLVSTSDYPLQLARHQDASFMARYAKFRHISNPQASPEFPLGLDLPGHDQDQNLAYYRAAYSPAVQGFLGSPNFRINPPTDEFDSMGFALSPDGRILATGESDGRILLWDIATGRELRSLSGHSDWVVACAWAPDGRNLASASQDKTVRIWDVATGRQLCSLQSDYVLACAWAPDGRTLASAISDYTIRLWDPITGRELRSLSGHSAFVLACAWAPDGKTLASASDDNTVRLWDTATGRELRSLSGHSGYVRACAWSPDGKTLASASYDQTVRLWDPATGRELRALFGHYDYVRTCAWAPDGRTLASASSDKTVRLWDVATGLELRSLSGHSGYVLACAWSPDGKTLASASDDNTVRLWDVATGRELRSLSGHSDWVMACAWAPDGRILASASSDKTVRLWDPAYSRELRSLSGHSGWVMACAWTLDGRTLASASSDKTVRLWDTATGRELRSLSGHSDWVVACAWAPDGRILASASDDQTVRLWDPATGRELRSLSGHSGYVRACAWAPDGRTLASASSDKTVRLWDVATGRELRSLSGHSDWVMACAWAPDGRTLASASSDKTIRLWDPATGRELRSLSGHSGSVEACAWATDGRILASASEDRTVRLWDSDTGREKRCFPLPSQATSVDFHPEGQLLVVGLASGISVLLDLRHAGASHA